MEKHSYLIENWNHGVADICGVAVPFPVNVQNVLVVDHLYSQDEKRNKRKIVTSFFIWPN